MSIKVVNKLPSEVNFKESDRVLVKKDLQEALDNHIETFEFEGDYNYKYLSQKVKETAQRFFYWEIYRSAAKYVEETLRDEFPEFPYLSANDGSRYHDKWFKVRNFKGEDRIHVYMTIDFRYLDTFKETLLNDTRLNYTLRREKNNKEIKHES